LTQLAGRVIETALGADVEAWRTRPLFAIMRAERKWLKAYNWTGALRASRSTSETDCPTDHHQPSPASHT